MLGFSGAPPPAGRGLARSRALHEELGPQRRRIMFVLAIPGCAEELYWWVSWLLSGDLAVAK